LTLAAAQGHKDALKNLNLLKKKTNSARNPLNAMNAKRVNETQEAHAVNPGESRFSLMPMPAPKLPLIDEEKECLLCKKDRSEFLKRLRNKVSLQAIESWENMLLGKKPLPTTPQEFNKLLDALPANCHLLANKARNENEKKIQQRGQEGTASKINLSNMEF
jgi:hypothetical protein